MTKSDTDGGRFFEARGVSVNYDRVSALRDVSMTLERGEVAALIGANGAGKTTMLRAITGLTRRAGGEIFLEGERIDGLPAAKIVARGVAMVPEGRRVYPHMDVRDNLLMGAYLRRDRAGIQADLEACFERFPRLRERIGQQAGTLSGGEQQMVAIARALMARPRLLLLDEPSLGLAPLLVREIARTIVALNREGLSVILVEQNSRMALRVSQRGYVLETGEMKLSGASADLLNNDEVRRLYLGG